MQLLTMNTTTVEERSVRVAARTIYDAATRGSPADPIAVVTAHTTLAREHHRVSGYARQAIDHYLDDTTWHQGPVALQTAIRQLADALDVLPPTTAAVAEQLQLFEPSIVHT